VDSAVVSLDSEPCIPGRDSGEPLFLELDILAIGQDGSAGLRVCAPGEGSFDLQGFDEETRVIVFDFEDSLLWPGELGMIWADHMPTRKSFHP
jgi:hypothetical protein